MQDRDEDRQLLAVLAHAGVDFNKPTPIIHLMCFPSKQSAESAAGELARSGFEPVSVDVSPPSSFWKRLFGPREYLCVAVKRGLLSEEHVFAASDQMNELARRFGGVYDGWECPVER